jgi:alkylation response protein AidB-like acyl-CoA dehydrogenase
MEPGRDRQEHRPLLRQLRALAARRVRSIFGGTTEIQKEIIARGLGLWA